MYTGSVGPGAFHRSRIVTLFRACLGVSIPQSCRSSVNASLAGERRRSPVIDPGYMSRKFESFERINSIRDTNGSFDSCNSCKWLGTAVYMSSMSQNFRLLLVWNLSVQNCRLFLLMYPGSRYGVANTHGLLRRRRWLHIGGPVGT